MAVSTKKKNILRAEWKTGIFKTKTALAKAHKLDPKTVGKIIGDLSQDNAELVESAVLVENAKKSLKNPMEINAVEKAVKTLTENQELVSDLTNKALKGIGVLLDKGSYKRPIKVKNGDYDVIEHVSYDLTSIDYKNCIDGIDKASITMGINSRFSTAIQVNAPLEINKSQQAPVITIIEDKHESRA